MAMLLRARVVLPVSRPLIGDGAVAIAGNRIQAVGRWKDLRAEHRGETFDLGDAVLLPGLINAHCHLDYTDLAGEIVPPKSFVDWVQAIVTLKAGWDYSDFAQSWLNGAKMLLRTGTTTVGDIEAVAELLPEVWDVTPLRVVSFLEMLDIKGRRPPVEIVAAARQKLEALPVGRGAVGLSPHAPYSTSPGLLAASAWVARRKQWIVTTHLAESAEEFEMFMYSRGAMFDWLKRSGRDMGDCGHGSPVQHVEKAGLAGNNLLAVHVNYLWQDDAARLGRQKASVVHCPRSHAYFRHQRFPRRELAEAGVNICLGTDSLASMRKVRGQPLELNMFAEMRALAATTADLPPETILRMATSQAARALGCAGKIGELSEHSLADLIVIPFAGKENDAYEAVLQHAGDVTAAMIDGQWAMAPPGEQL